MRPRRPRADTPPASPSADHATIAFLLATQLADSPPATPDEQGMRGPFSAKIGECAPPPNPSPTTAANCNVRDSRAPRWRTDDS